MIEFITNPIVEVKGENIFVLSEDFIVKCYDFTLIIPAGFETDFASVPRIPIIYALFAGKAKKSAVLHDYLYSTKMFPREQCDELFLCAMEAEGVDLPTRKAMYLGVRIGGAKYYEN